MRDNVRTLRAALEATGRARVRMTGTSMNPTLIEGMELELRPASERLRRGDVVVFPNGQTLVAHRVVGRYKENVQTAGDAQPHIVESVAPASIVGRVAQRPLEGARGTALAYARPLRAQWPLWRARFRALRRRDRSARLFLRAVSAAICEDVAELAYLIERFGDDILRIALEERCLLYLRSHAREAVDAQLTWRDEIRRQLAAASMQNTLLRREAVAVSEVLARKDISAILLKGAARAVDDAEAWRHPSSDLDVLVPPHDVQAAVAALSDRGYRTWETPGEYIAHHHAAPLVSPTGIVVEIHTALVRLDVQRDQLPWQTLQKAASVSRLEPATRVLDESAALYHLLVHSLEQVHIRDIVLAGQAVRANPHLLPDVRALIDAAGARVRLHALLDFACRLARIDPAPRGVERWFTAWIECRFALPRKLQDYSQLVDAALIASAGDWRDAADSVLRYVALGISRESTSTRFAKVVVRLGARVLFLPVIALAVALARS